MSKFNLCTHCQTVPLITGSTKSASVMCMNEKCVEQPFVIGRTLEVATITWNRLHAKVDPTAPTNDWIYWDGGECPVAREQLVEYRTIDGYTQICAAGALRWTYTNSLGNIAAYRRVPSDSAKTEK